MSTVDLGSLNARFAIPGQLQFVEGPGGMAVCEVENAQATARIVLQGAHLTHWAPRGAHPVIWTSSEAKYAPGKSIRGGVPVCWPWFGPHASEPKFPGHGFARTVPWGPVASSALADGRTSVAFRLLESDATRAQWPHPSQLELRMTIGDEIEFDLVTRNTGAEAITVGDALHTYFEVGDVRQVEVQGLEGCPYLDKVAGGRHRQQGPVNIAAEVDRVYLESIADCLIEDPVLHRRIRISKRNSASSVVWNPWVEKADKMGDLGPDGYLRMLCVESCNADADVVRVPPGGAHHLWVRYSLESFD